MKMAFWRTTVATAALLCCHWAGAQSVRLIFAGDLMLDDGPGRVVAAGGDPLSDVAPILADADFRIANLETPVATKGEANANKIYTFRASPRVLSIVKSRFDAVSVANNHSGDFGHAAFVETLQLLDANGIGRFGGGLNLKEAHAPLWIRKNGLKIAVLGYNEFKPRSFEAGATWPGVAWSEDSQVVADIQAARAAGADLVIPFMHWGWEREPEPSPRQRQLARLMIDKGADMVVGSHPHVTQGVETYHGKPIIYSLGNFVFDGFELPAAKVGWILRAKLDKKGVVAWDLKEVHMDDDGVPHPAPANLPGGGRKSDGKVAAY